MLVLIFIKEISFKIFKERKNIYIHTHTHLFLDSKLDLKLFMKNYSFKLKNKTLTKYYPDPYEGQSSHHIAKTNKR